MLILGLLIQLLGSGGNGYTSRTLPALDDKVLVGVPGEVMSNGSTDLSSPFHVQILDIRTAGAGQSVIEIKITNASAVSQHFPLGVDQKALVQARDHLEAVATLKVERDGPEASQLTIAILTSSSAKPASFLALGPKQSIVLNVPWSGHLRGGEHCVVALELSALKPTGFMTKRRFETERSAAFSPSLNTE